jgi:hypothetical protein
MTPAGLRGWSRKKPTLNGVTHQGQTSLGAFLFRNPQLLMSP